MGLIGDLAIAGVVTHQCCHCRRRQAYYNNPPQGTSLLFYYYFSFLPLFIYLCIYFPVVAQPIYVMPNQAQQYLHTQGYGPQNMQQQPIVGYPAYPQNVNYGY
jgi:hypothetical protein